MKLALTAALLLVGGTARSEQWLQRFHDAQHTNFIGSVVDQMVTETFRYTFDPDQIPRGDGVYLIHYTDPKIEADGSMLVPVIVRNGSVVVSNSVKKISGGTEAWTFDSDFLRQPGGSWEPIFDFAVDPTGTIVYVAGRYGCVWLLNESDGTLINRKCATDPVDPTGQNIWDVSPFTIDGNGNVFWTIRSSSSLIRSSLVKLDASGNITTSDIENLSPGANQIAANNASPAVSADNSTLYLATARNGGSGAHLIALDLNDPTLTTVLWDTALNAAFGCPAPILNESGTSSPVALPDGGAAIGGWAGSPVSEGSYYSLDSGGTARGCYRFGWDDTMGQIALNGTNYLVGKHNHYTPGTQCNNGIDPPRASPCYEIVVLNSTTMEKLWSYISDEVDGRGVPYEWCIDAPTLYKRSGPDGDIGYVVAPSEGGNMYNLKLFSNPPEFTRIRVGGPQNAAYVPTVSIGGNAYTINHGQVVGVGE